MRLDGFFKGDTPYFLIGVKSDRPKIRKQIHFMLDTGSDITGISLRDRLAMEHMSLRGLKPGRSISGLADKARTSLIENTELRLMTDKKSVERFGPIKIYFIDTTPECPSLLGRDFLKNLNLK